MSKNQQPPLPERLFVARVSGEDGVQAAGTGMLGTLIGLLAAEKSGLYEPARPAKPAAGERNTETM